MDLNQLLFQHQVAVMRTPDRAAFGASIFDLVGHYERRIARLRRSMGVAQYPMWATGQGD
ncbi:hypothetical protein [uncultured Novosphingobium sp.]|uniref:hypothetical protein n=1 Tax=uncultured Novosphingobium sp. TaxID=292277 RepID=UPI003749FF3A